MLYSYEYMRFDGQVAGSVHATQIKKHQFCVHWQCSGPPSKLRMLTKNINIPPGCVSQYTRSNQPKTSIESSAHPAAMRVRGAATASKYLTRYSSARTKIASWITHPCIAESVHCSKESSVTIYRCHPQEWHVYQQLHCSCIENLLPQHIQV